MPTKPRDITAQIRELSDVCSSASPVSILYYRKGGFCIRINVESEDGGANLTVEHKDLATAIELAKTQALRFQQMPKAILSKAAKPKTPATRNRELIERIRMM